MTALGCGGQGGIPVVGLFSIGDKGRFRKPAPGMLDYAMGQAGDGSGLEMLDRAKSCYVGDAAGRKKDFSNSDYKMAVNAGIAFHTPEAFFNMSAPFGHVKVPPLSAKKEATMDPATLPGPKPLPEGLVAPEGTADLLLLHGSPAAGKSTLCRETLAPAGYTVVNQDTLGSKDRCLKAVREALANAGGRVVVDATNRDRATRRDWVLLAKELAVPVRSLEVRVKKPLAFHLNAFRAATGGRAVSSVVLHTFHKYAERPTEEEGFARTLVWEPGFADDVHPWMRFWLT